jgi:ABC-type cobalamin/Fe3+-siderophores transport system ATPase subunit
MANMDLELYKHLVETSTGRIADNWRRRETVVRIERPLNILGYPFVLRTNAEPVAALAELSERRFSRCTPVPDARVGQIDLFTLHDAGAEALTLLQLEGQFETLASGSRGLIRLGPWGSMYVDWAACTAFGSIAPALLSQPAIASRHALDTFMLVALLREPFGMLHASGLVKDGRVVLLVGPHGAGKSTTALHLIRTGYRLISDTLIFTREVHGPVHSHMAIMGYAVGELKLTAEGRVLFPELPGESADLSIDGRRKPIFDLRALMPERIETGVVTPASIVLCLVRRSADSDTHLHPLDEDIMLHQIIRDTSYLDEVEVMAQNLSVIDLLIKRSHNYILELGSDPAEIVAAIEGAGAHMAPLNK